MSGAGQQTYEIKNQEQVSHSFQGILRGKATSELWPFRRYCKQQISLTAIFDPVVGEIAIFSPGTMSCLWYLGYANVESRSSTSLGGRCRSRVSTGVAVLADYEYGTHLPRCCGCGGGPRRHIASQVAIGLIQTVVKIQPYPH